MPLRLDIKEVLRKPSERVKSVDLHPTEPWILAGLYDGNVIIYNIETGKVVKAFEIAPGTPVRCARFVARLSLVVAGSDDFMLRAVNYNTGDKVAEQDAHSDYIRYVEPHPSSGALLTASDDMTLKLWDMGNGFKHIHTFEGHAHFVMMARFNPKDANTFASASLDRSVKVWTASGQAHTVEPNFSLDGHERGVNCVDYFHGGDRPYLISGADDHTLRIWDYQTRSCVTVLEGHSDNISAVLYHPRLPLIASGSEDGTIRIWHAATYKTEATLSYGLDRCWAVGASVGSNRIAMGFDGGCVVATLGDDVPISSMDRSGKLLTADNNQIVFSTVRAAFATGGGPAASAAAAGEAASAATGPEDGARLELRSRDMGSIDMYPRALLHNSNGRFVAALGDNEYVIYTAQALRSKSFGKGRDLAWSAQGSGDYAVLTSSSGVSVFKDFREAFEFRVPFAATKVSGGALLAVQRNDFVQFWAWDQEMFVMQVDAECLGVHWNESGDFVAITTPDATYILEHNKDAVMAASMATGDDAARIAAEGVDGALTVVHELHERIVSAEWAGDCLLFVTSRGKLCYFVGGRTITVAVLPGPQHILGYLQKDGRVVMQNRSGEIFSYALAWPLLDYQTAVVRRDFDRANTILPGIPRDQHTRIAKFLEAQGFKEEALAVSTDPEHRFELAIALNRLDIAHAITTEAAAEAEADEVEVEARWRQLADLALSRGDIKLSLECAKAGKDHPTLLLLYTSLGHAEGLAELAQDAEAAGRANVALAARLALSDASGAVDILRKSGRVADAAIFARAHCPSRAAEATSEWIGHLRARAARGDRGAERAAEAIANPAEYANLFEGWELALETEQAVADSGALPCSSAQHATASAMLDAGVNSDEGWAALTALAGGEVAADLAAAEAPEPEDEPEAAPAESPEAPELPTAPVASPTSPSPVASSGAGSPGPAAGAAQATDAPVYAPADADVDAAADDDQDDAAAFDQDDFGDDSAAWQPASPPAAASPSPAASSPQHARVEASSPPRQAADVPAAEPAAAPPAPVEAPEPAAEEEAIDFGMDDFATPPGEREAAPGEGAAPAAAAPAADDDFDLDLDLGDFE
ncbi:hypothetical protein FNF29_06946 [Cafeteria roenbergensis]|uniref:Beta'-coat protein n=2 Tax=Cafeteria roenbergensis TaxID=33653 RepID=A0A5A8DRV9_CAFRO|nr:hypothetical protein FNF29_06946 [Cafeteria roenbergensis]KAA0168143.1 hypothetical protein FNF31_00641 [Cafeteria roenbergensis]KAA0169354.1 hypothetical protein FNF28_02135 [Cafeteria roenbergensis]|eukprot:KAA0148002.1 hypothetical protein FNF29_06946 [Cafeteria roenbergensis]